MDRSHIVAYLNGEATWAERVAVEAWRRESVENEAEFLRMTRVWGLLGHLNADPFTGRSDVHAAPRARSPLVLPIRGGAAPQKGVSKEGRRRIAGWITLSAAALAIGLALGSLLPHRAGDRGLAAENIVTGAGEIATLSLRDGTVVRVGPNTRIRFRDAPGPRDVFLEGQAYFAVPRGQKYPFRVHTEGGEVTVLGTRFDVEARGGDVQVVVVEGEVEVGPRDLRVSVRGGEMARVEEEVLPVVETLEDVYTATSWIGAFLAYESTPLHDVAREFESRFGLMIEFADAEIASRTVTGWFADQAPADMVTSICLAVHAACSLVDGAILIHHPVGGGD